MKRTLLAIFLTGAPAALFATPSAAEIVQLKDGSHLEGSIRRTDDGWMVTDKSGKQTLVSFEHVASIEATVKAGTDIAEQRLASLRRALDNVVDPRQAIDRYKTFVTQYPGTTAVHNAKVDLAIWQDRLDKHLIKIGDKWASATEKSEIEREAQSVAAEGLRLVAQSKLRDATAVIDKALSSNPKEPAALYLKGVVHFRQDQLPLARKAFEESLAAAPDHVPTMVNLAVILWRQNAQPAALTQYDKALLVSPADRRILDNLAEALNALPEEQRNSALTKKIVRHFNEQDLALAAKLKLKGLFRWGATWVNAAEMERNQKVEKEIQDKLNAMSTEFDTSAARIAQIDNDIAANEKVVKRMEAASVGIDANGRIIQYPLPPAYYDVKRDIATLKSEKVTRSVQQDALRRSAKQLQQQTIGTKYTGIQRLVDVEGTPLPNAAAIAAAAISGAPAPSVRPTAPAATTPAPAIKTPPVTPTPRPPAPRASTVPPSTTKPVSTAPPVVIPPEKPTVMDRH